MGMLPFLLAMIAVESFAIASAGWRQSASYLRKIIVVQMILVALFAPKLFVIAGFQSNVASIFYATVFTAQLVVAKRWGTALAMENVWTVLGSMLIFYALIGILGVMPAANEHDAVFTRVLYEISALTPLNAIASLGSFLVAQLVMLGVLQRFTMKWVAAPLAVVLGQAVDSAIFYPIVFDRLPFEITTQIAIDGFLTKIAVAVALIPAYLYAVRQRPDDFNKQA